MFCLMKLQNRDFKWLRIINLALANIASEETDI